MQGAYKEHINILQDLDVSPVEIRNKNDLQNIDGIIIPAVVKALPWENLLEPLIFMMI